MRKILIAAAAVAALAPQFAAAQEAGSLLVRARAVTLQSDNNNNDQLKATLATLPGSPSQITINDKTLPEVDFTYFFTKNLAAELILTYPQKQTIRLDGGIIGSFKHLPPVLTAQYHFTDMGAIRPYIGAGVNLTLISNVKFDPALSALGLSLDKNSFGLAAQLGADVQVGGGWMLNFDVKKVKLDTAVKSNGTKIGTFAIDPLLISVGLGKTF
jgi:outer membrane protein